MTQTGNISYPAGELGVLGKHAVSPFPLDSGNATTLAQLDRQTQTSLFQPRDSFSQQRTDRTIVPRRFESFSTTSRYEGIRPGVRQQNARLENDEEACIWIERLVANEPVEDGVEHAAEADLQAVLGIREEAGKFVNMLMHRSSRNRPDLLRLLARIGFPIRTEERQALVSDALHSDSVGLRDAAIQAIETWNDKGLTHLLEKYEDEVRWLAEYANDVAKELSE